MHPRTSPASRPDRTDLNGAPLVSAEFPDALLEGSERVIAIFARSGERVAGPGLNPVCRTRPAFSSPEACAACGSEFGATSPGSLNSGITGGLPLEMPRRRAMVHKSV